ncbi:MAG: hypothetical protein LCH93_07020 [Proteobacteria bacterium]|nr:hypothetical protein [Pseudomonadota bacterium]
MAATDFCSIHTSVSEGAFNKLILNVRRQRPSLFNYGTAAFVGEPELLCEVVEVAPGLPISQPRVALQPLLPVPGTGGTWGFEYCAQLADLRIDFHPGSQFTLPRELDPLRPQQFALKIEVCLGLACPGKEYLDKIAEIVEGTVRPADPRDTLGAFDKFRPEDDRPPPRARPLPVHRENIKCFCLSLFATGTVAVKDDAFGKRLSLALDGLELVDIRPEGLEAILECLIEATVRLSLLPRLKVAVDDLIFGLGKFGQLVVGLTPTSGNVPFNPSIANDRVAVFIDAVAS